MRCMCTATNRLARPWLAALGYLAGSFGYVAIPVIVVLIAARPNWAIVADMLWPADTERRLAAAAFWGPLLLPAAAALVSGTEITSLWSMSAWTLLPVLLLSPPAITLREIDTRRILAAAVAIPIVMLIASPVDCHHRAAQRPAARCRRKPSCWRARSSAFGMRRRHCH